MAKIMTSRDELFRAVWQLRNHCAERGDLEGVELCRALMEMLERMPKEAEE